MQAFLSISTLQSSFWASEGIWGHTRYSGYRVSDESTDAFVCDHFNKVVEMPSINSNDHFEGRNRHVDSLSEENLAMDGDLLMEQILENINTTPVGQMLKKIASLPEVRKEKVVNVRRQLTEGKYNLNERLDIALEKVLEDLTT